MDPVVTTTAGRVRGRVRMGVYEFLGIPYAAAPVGPARFELPRRREPWTGIRDASAHGETCSQPPYTPPVAALLGADGTSGEDCLHVNVWTPDPVAAGLPVLVWIHGGAFIRGSNARKIYAGTNFARDGVVTVSINYRLGIPGFAAVRGAPQNRGLHDQIFALRWVQENIARFGGDPDNVTVFGESAGAMSIAVLIAAPTADGLFRRAIMQSGNGSVVATATDAFAVADRMAARLGIANSAAEFGECTADDLSRTQESIAAEVLSAPDADSWGIPVLRAGLGIMSLIPVIDGDLVTGQPVDILRAHPSRNVPILTGTNTDEYRFYTVPAGRTADITAVTAAAALTRFGIDPAVLDIYAAHRRGAPPSDVCAAILTDWAFRSETIRLAQVGAAAGAPTFVYEFGWRSGVEGLGACHILEVPFVFDTTERAQPFTGPHPPQALADEMHRAWVDFATDGEPGWPQFEPSDPLVRLFGSIESPTCPLPRAEEIAALRNSIMTS